MSKSAAELRNELKELRKSHPDYKPVSRMAKADVSELIGKLKNKLEVTPAVAMDKVKAPKESMTKKKVVDESGLLEEHEHAEKKHKGAVKHAKDIKHSKEVVHAKEMKHPKKAVVKDVSPKSVDDKKEAAKKRMAAVRAMKKNKKE